MLRLLPEERDSVEFRQFLLEYREIVRVEKASDDGEQPISTISRRNVLEGLDNASIVIFPIAIVDAKWVKV